MSDWRRRRRVDGWVGGRTNECRDPILRLFLGGFLLAKKRGVGAENEGRI
jgi:hypothetical protein